MPLECPREGGGGQAMNTTIRKGKVYLMGAGPGNPDLLTVQATQILKTAEVVLHDHLVAQEILDLLPAWTQVRNVGKRCGQAGISQEQIHALLIASAREGKQVVRLKGGDPLLFGRVGEEMEALARAGVEFEVIPGVTSAMGAAASAKIPLTDRRYASKLIFLSHHTAGNVSPEWGDVVRDCGERDAGGAADSSHYAAGISAGRAAASPFSADYWRSGAAAACG